jgi:hypothetical protein
MDINSRSFAGEATFRQQFAAAACNMVRRAGRLRRPTGNGCDLQSPAPGTIIGLEGTAVAPGLKPQYLDERIAGVEYELMEDLKLGIAYQNRELGRVIEDVSTDGANTYIIANPGEWVGGRGERARGAAGRGHRPGRDRVNRLTNLLDPVPRHPHVRQAVAQLRRAAVHRVAPLLEGAVHAGQLHLLPHQG